MKETIEILINPIEPDYMDDRALEERSDEHMNEWLNVPFIRTEDFGEDNYIEYCERMSFTQKDDYTGNYKLETEEEFNNRRKEDRERWLKNWPEDKRYDERMLDGGSWDRTSDKGSYKTLEEAKSRCKELMNQFKYK